MKTRRFAICCFAVICLLEWQSFAGSISDRLDYSTLAVRDTAGVLTDQETSSVKMLLPVLADAFDVNTTVSLLTTESLARVGVELSAPDYSFIETAKEFSPAWQWKEVNVAESYVEVCSDSDACIQTSDLKAILTQLKSQDSTGTFIKLYVTYTDAEDVRRKAQFWLMKPQGHAGQKLILAPTGEMVLADGESYTVNLESTVGKTFIAARNKDYPVPYDVGDKVPDVAFFDLATSEPIKLSSLRGKVVFLDFWATWCGPCQKPMAHAQATAKANEDSWKGRVVVLAASVDDGISEVQEHVKKNGWSDLRHVWCGQKEDGGGANEIFDVTGVPTAYLIDQEGEIRWRGHPSDISMEAEINKLLSDK